MIEAFKLLIGIAKLDYSLFFKLSGDFKVRGHTYKIVKNSFCLVVMKNFFSNSGGCMEWVASVCGWCRNCEFFEGKIRQILS